MVIDCYHGTTSSRAEIIESTGFILSDKPRMWLGTGAYFFQEGYDRCRSWAEKVCRRPDAKRSDYPVVFHAKINLQYGIDLTNNDYWPLLREIYNEHAQDLLGYEQNGIDTLVRELSERERKIDADHPLDHWLIDKLVDVERLNRRINGFPEPTVVRSAFAQGKAVDKRSWLFDHSSVIVSVIDLKCIEDLRLIRPKSAK